MINKGSSFADFVRFRLQTYARTQQLLPPLWVAIKQHFVYFNVAICCNTLKNFLNQFL